MCITPSGSECPDKVAWIGSADRNKSDLAGLQKAVFFHIIPFPYRPVQCDGVLTHIETLLQSKTHDLWLDVWQKPPLEM